MKDFFRRNGILILIAAVLLALVTAVVSALLGGTADPLSNLANLITTPIRNGINAVVNWTGERYSDAFEQEQLKQENEELKQRVAELEQMERDTGLVLSGSPTQTVGGEILEELMAVRHTKPMLSANKTKSVEDLIRFASLGPVILN